MLVEDEPDIGMIVSQMLGSQYEIVRAVNGLEALERLNWYQPDLTIMDLMMPVLDGFDTTRAIKKDNEYASMPVLFLTARKDNRAVREALMAGGDIYLEKPFDPPELMVRIQEMIDRNAVVPRRKTYTLEQIHDHFDNPDKPSTPQPQAPVDQLPLTAQLARAAAEPKARVLIITSSEQLLSEAKAQLKSRVEVIMATDPETALDKIAAYQPDIVAIDIEMPKFNGFHFVQLLRINRHLRVNHVIFLSPESSDDIQAEVRRINATLLVGDPITADDITAAINTVIKSETFRRQRKRLDYREILRREDPADDDI